MRIFIQIWTSEGLARASLSFRNCDGICFSYVSFANSDKKRSSHHVISRIHVRSHCSDKSVL